MAEKCAKLGFTGRFSQQLGKVSFLKWYHRIDIALIWTRTLLSELRVRFVCLVIVQWHPDEIVVAKFAQTTDFGVSAGLVGSNLTYGEGYALQLRSYRGHTSNI